MRPHLHVRLDKRQRTELARLKAMDKLRRRQERRRAAPPEAGPPPAAPEARRPAP